jgi:uncharacterized protein Yka (UPF0111/DUF47 family)
MNDDLKQLHNALMAQHQALYSRLDTVTDPVAAKAIITEMQEVLHRVDRVQGLLFKKTTAELGKSLKKVQKANGELTDALEKAQNTADIIKGVSDFLSFVDDAMDIAKAIAV